MNQQVADAAQQQRTSADALSNGMAHVNQVTQSAVALSQRIMEAAAQADHVAESLESNILRFKTASETEAEDLVELF